MESLILEGTDYTPKVELRSDGHILLIGKSLPEDTFKFYEPLLKWVNECSIEKVNMTFRMEYMNSSSAHQISKFLMTAKNNPWIKETLVEWHYESNDEDGLDFGKELQEMTDFPFQFYQYAELEA